MINTPENINIFIAYVEEDRSFLEELAEHLSVLERLGMVDKIWYKEMIVAGLEWEKETLKALQNADIILLLISSKFIATDFSYNQEMKQALVRHEEGKAKTIPIILRPCMWDGTPFSKLQVLPKNKIPVSSKKWKHVDEPYVEIVEHVEEIIIDLKQIEIGGDQQKEHSEFNRSIEEAAHYFTAGKWEEAQWRYREALSFATHQSPEKLASIEERIALCKVEIFFQHSFARGEKAYREERFSDAKIAFADALSIKPEDEETLKFQKELDTTIPTEKTEIESLPKSGKPKFFQIKLFGIEIFKIVVSLCMIGVVGLVGLRLFDQDPVYTARVEGNRVSYVDATGEVVLDTDFRNGRDFAYGMAPVENEMEKWGYINLEKETQFDFTYDNAWPHTPEGLAYVQKSGKCGFIDLEGEVRIPFKYQDAASYSEGLAMVKKGKNDFAFIDVDGQEEISGLEDVLTPGFKNGEAVVIKSGQTMTIDRTGNCLEGCPPETAKRWSEDEKKKVIKKFEKEIEVNMEAGEYQRTLMKVKEVKKLSSTTEEKIKLDNQIDLLQRKISKSKEAKYQKLLKEAEPFFRKGDFKRAKELYESAVAMDIIFDEQAKRNLALCEKHLLLELNSAGAIYGFKHPNGSWGIKNQLREVLVAPKYDSIGVFANGLIAVQEEGLWGFVNQEGVQQIKPFYESVEPFSAAGLAKVFKDGKEGFIDRNGRRAEPRGEE